MAPAQDHKPWERLRKSWDKPQKRIWDCHPPTVGNTKIRSTRTRIFRNIFIKTHCKDIFVQVFLGLHPETGFGITASCKSKTKHSSMTKNSKEQDEHPASCGRQGTKLSCSKLWDSPVPVLRRPWIKMWQENERHEIGSKWNCSRREDATAGNIPLGRIQPKPWHKFLFSPRSTITPHWNTQRL